jgi:hypothetical protein
LGDAVSSGLVEIRSTPSKAIVKGLLVEQDAEFELCVGDDLRVRFRSVPEPQVLADFVSALRTAR